MQLLHAACACDDRAHVGILEDPCQGELRQCATQFLCDWLKCADFGKLVLIGHAIVKPIIAFERGAAVFRDAI